MPAESYTNREEREKRAEENNAKRMPEQTNVFPISGSLEEVTPENYELISHFTRRKFLLKHATLYAEYIVQGTHLMFEIATDGVKQTYQFDIKRGLNELPAHLTIESNSVFKAYLVNTQEELSGREVHFTAEIFNY